jgi:hemerythrin-like domain-containing protein
MKRAIYLMIALIALITVAWTAEAQAGESYEKPVVIPVSPVEDLMREHGILRRIMLIYEKEAAALEKGKAPNYEAIAKSAAIIQDFIENYHEKLEEEYIFPIFEKAGKHADLTKTLRAQHEAGRKLTRIILQLSKEGQSADIDNPNASADHLLAFIKMYRPHAAREDTVLFPELRELISEKEYNEMGDRFEDREHELFGRNGFEGRVKEVSEIEKELGIYELAGFTPK